MKISYYLLNIFVYLSLINIDKVGAIPININGERINKSVRTLKDIRYQRNVRQKFDYTCGAAALATILRYQYQENISEKEIIETLLTILGNRAKIALEKGFSLLDIKQYVTMRGYKGIGYAELDLKSLQKLNLPVIVPVNLFGFSHFVVFRGIKSDRVIIADPAWGNTTIPIDEFNTAWPSKIGFIIVPKDQQPTQNYLAVKDEELLYLEKRTFATKIDNSFGDLSRREIPKILINSNGQNIPNSLINLDRISP